MLSWISQFRKVDVSDYDAVERFVQEVASKFERIDGLVNGAGSELEDGDD